MSTWRCPHCGTFQAESSRCFLCGRSSISCATCVNFREALVGGVGYCAIDKRREPLSGAEQRACWTGAADASSKPAVAADSPYAGLLDVIEAAAAEAPPRHGALRPVSGQ